MDCANRDKYICFPRPDNSPNSMSPTPHTRWSPTREQLMVLEELYRMGMRNPKPLQIQGIAAYLSGFGKIQNKNVFYWFQNHKARDRQKIRNKMQQQHLMQLQHLPNFQNQSNSADIIPSSPPTPPSVLVPHCFSPHNSLATQVGKAYIPHAAAAAAGLEEQAWWKDMRAESPARTNGHDHMMTADVGLSPTASGCWSGPLETLELFPLRPASVTNQH